MPLRLAHRGPYAAAGIFDHLAARALTGVEEMAGEPGDRTYRRTLDLPNGTGIAEVGERTGDGWLECRLHLGDLRDLTTAIQRMRRLFDLDADPDAVAERLGADPALAPLVARSPGCAPPAPPTSTNSPSGRSSASRSPWPRAAGSAARWSRPTDRCSRSPAAP